MLAVSEGIGLCSDSSVSVSAEERAQVIKRHLSTTARQLNSLELSGKIESVLYLLACKIWLRSPSGSLEVSTKYTSIRASQL